MSDHERGTKRRTAEAGDEPAKEEQRPGKSAAHSAPEHADALAPRSAHVGEAAPHKGSETSASHLVAGQRALDTILQRLTTTTPRNAIDSIQREFGLDGSLLPLRTIIPVLPLLDQLGVSRAETYSSLLNALQAKMIETVGSMNPATPAGKEKLESLLETTFPFIGFEELRAVPIKVMLTMTRVPPSFLKQLSQNPHLYRNCDIRIQRQIWQADEMLFRSEVLPLLNERLLVHAEEIATPGGALDWSARHEKRGHSDEEATAVWNPKARRDRDTLLQALVRLIGDSLPLYRMLLHLLRTLYATTASPAFCTLRLDVLLCLHDHSAVEVFEKDPCDNLALQLDAFLRDRKVVDPKRVRDLMTELKSIASAGLVALQDAAMLFADPYVEQALVRDLFARMLDVLDREATPKDDEPLCSITQMLVLGLSARDRKNAGVYKLPKEVVASFFPALANTIVDAKIYDISKTDADATPPAIAPLAAFFTMPLARKLVLYYVVRRLEEGDATLFAQFAEFADRTSFSVSSEPALALSLVSVALHTKHADVRTAVIENFLMKRRAESTHIQRQLARYFLHGLRHYAVPALVALLQLLAVAVASTQSAPASDALETKQRQALQQTLRQIHDKVAARPGAAEHIGAIAEWARRPEDGAGKEALKQVDEKKDAGTEAGKSAENKGAARSVPQQSAEAHEAAHASPTK